MCLFMHPAAKAAGHVVFHPVIVCVSETAGMADCELLVVPHV
jgi:hypothetical protein